MHPEFARTLHEKGCEVKGTANIDVASKQYVDALKMMYGNLTSLEFDRYARIRPRAVIRLCRAVPVVVESVAGFPSPARV